MIRRVLGLFLLGLGLLALPSLAALAEPYTLVLPPDFLGGPPPASSTPDSTWIPTTDYSSQSECENAKAGMQWLFFDDKGNRTSKPIPANSACVPSASFFNQVNSPSASRAKRR
jgi:hypothetical protein